MTVSVLFFGPLYQSNSFSRMSANTESAGKLKNNEAQRDGLEDDIELRSET
jgi:hypothetical protein